MSAPPQLPATATSGWLTAAEVRPPASLSQGLDLDGGETQGEGVDPSSRTIVITAFGTPKPKGSLKPIGNNRMVEQVKGSSKWRGTMASAARRAMKGRPPINGPVHAAVIFYVPHLKTPRHSPCTRSSGDLDKLLRNAFDSISGIVVTDDSRIVSVAASKVYAATTTGCRIEIRPL
jgi:Holliday junction resolvase RusA-like endonuclease